MRFLFWGITIFFIYNFWYVLKRGRENKETSKVIIGIIGIIATFLIATYIHTFCIRQY
jgi:hypothetical protein